MNNNIDEVEKFAYSFPSLSIKEYDELLKNKSLDNQKKFINGFIQYIFRISKSFYLKNEESFNAYYDFEELFNDGIILAMELYQKNYYCSTDKYKTFCNYCHYYFFDLGNLIINSYFAKISPVTYYKLKDVIDIRRKAFEEYGSTYSDHELIEKANIPKEIAKKVVFETPLLDNSLEVEYEDMILDKVFNESLHNELMKALNELRNNAKNAILEIFGISDENIERYEQSNADYARKVHLSRSRVQKIKNKGLERIKENHPELKKYLTR